MIWQSTVANAGTPFVWAGCFMLIIGNALIGYFEAWVLSLYCKVSVTSTGKYFAVVNFITGGIGFFVPWDEHGVAQLFDETAVFEKPHSVMMAGWLVFFALTVLMEWPLYCWILKKQRVKASAILACILANTISYLLLILLSLPVSNFSGPQTLSYKRSISDLSRRPPVATLLFIEASGRKLEVLSIETGHKVAQIDLMNSKPELAPFDDLGFAKTPTNKFRLMVHVQRVNQYDYDKYTILRNVPIKESQVENLYDVQGGWKAPLVGLPHARYFGDESTRKYIVHNSGFAGYSFEVLNSDYLHRKSLSFETPFAKWHWRNQIAMPDGWMIAESNKMIFLIDYESGEMVRIADGTAPMVHLGEPVISAHDGKL